MQTIAERLWIPADTQAILWDMDGVLIDSLSLDLIVCNQLLKQYFGSNITVSKEFIRSIFAYDPNKFWEFILNFVKTTYNIPEVMLPLNKILEAFHQARHDCIFALNPGILEILQANKSLKMAVVSNNPTQDVENILKNCGIANYFACIVGNDIEKVAKKPAPDTYLLATRLLNVTPEKCIVVEDSLIGIEAGNNAKCYTIGVATGGTEFNVLEQKVQQVYSSFTASKLAIQFGDVRNKQITTPNDFMSHAIEHIAWRLGIEIKLQWHNNDWWTLGTTLGNRIREFPEQEQAAVALGMIDDGSAEVFITISDTPLLDISAIENVDLDWFLALRCEQTISGKPLLEFAQGLAHGLRMQIAIKVCSVEDPHHTWEGIFRAIGIALSKIFTPKSVALPYDYLIEKSVSEGELSVLAKSLHYSKVCRGTAESYVEVAVDFSKQRANSFTFNVAPSIDVSEFHNLLEILAKTADFTLQVDFNATVLSSSHVVLEDTALVLGRALLEILTLRMVKWGVNGAGASIDTYSSFTAIRVGISVEGRKFWKFVPFEVSLEQVRQEFIIGHNIYKHLRSEDLDDFLDGLAGGLACSIIIHIEELIEPNLGWQLLFENLGKALKEVFVLNCNRKGVPPGVKATLS
jgi:HAD superfamily hydrolase (TIGR01509 family)